MRYFFGNGYERKADDHRAMAVPLETPTWPARRSRGVWQALIRRCLRQGMLYLMEKSSLRDVLEYCSLGRRYGSASPSRERHWLLVVWCCVWHYFKDSSLYYHRIRYIAIYLSLCLRKYLIQLYCRRYYLYVTTRPTLRLGFVIAKLSQYETSSWHGCVRCCALRSNARTETSWSGYRSKNKLMCI